MSFSSSQQKSLMYYYLMRGYYGQLLSLCDSIISKKGKDPISMFWKAFALGSTGNIPEALRQLESFSSRKDLLYPVSLAMLYFHQKAQVVDREAVEMLSSEVSLAEDVSKESGFVLAARFSLYTNDYSGAARLVQKLYNSSSNDLPTSVFEHEGMTIDYWCTLHEYNSRKQEVTTSAHIASLKKRLVGLDNLFKGKLDQIDVDMMMLYVKSKLVLESNNDALNILNQMIAMYPWYNYGLTEKALMLASMLEWDQALDAAQRALDLDENNIDALQVIVIHAFTQESQPDDSVQKLDDLDKILVSREPYSPLISLAHGKLCSTICSRQPRALEICLRMLERALRNVVSVEQESLVNCCIGNLRIIQGPTQYYNAMKAFKEAIRRDSSNITALEGMIKCQLFDGQIEDAESQLELMLVMHASEDLSYDFQYLKGLLSKELKKDMETYINSLNDCKNGLLKALQVTKGNYFIPFNELSVLNPDFALLLAVEYLSQVQGNISSIPLYSTAVDDSMNDSSTVQGNEITVSDSKRKSKSIFGMPLASLSLYLHDETSDSTVLSSNNSNSNSTSYSALQSAISILKQLLKYCPGHISNYVELARCLSAQGAYEEACRQLRLCLSFQPNSCPALIALAKIEVSRLKTQAAKHALEQALSSDFSIRSSTLFRLISVYVNAQQGKYDEAMKEMEVIIKLPDILKSSSIATNHKSSNDPSLISNHPMNENMSTNPLRLSDDDRVSAFITYSYLLSKNKRLKEAKEVLANAKVIFVGTDQEVQVIVASSQLAVERKDYDSAIRMLDKIADDSTAFIHAQMIKADILLIHHRDKEGYINCYNQLVEKDQSAKNYAALGEAYLRILNPELAVNELQKAYKLDPVVNSKLRSRIGRSLIATHEYHRATEFYENCIKDIQKSLKTSISSGFNESPKPMELIALTHELSKLYKKLGRFEAANRILNQVLNIQMANGNIMSQNLDINNVPDLKHDIITLLLLADIRHSNIQFKEFLVTLQYAKDLQKLVVS